MAFRTLLTKMALCFLAGNSMALKVSVKDLQVWNPMINGASLIQKGRWLSRVSMMPRCLSMKGLHV